MRLQTILYQTERIKGFKYGKIRKHEIGDSCYLSVRILPRRNSRPFCSGCGRRGPVHDKLPDRQFQHIPIYGIAVVFLYAMRRVKCDRCGVKVEMVPWGDGKNRLTTSCRWFLASWAKRLSWTEVATIFHSSWDSVMRAVEHAVAWGLEHRDLSGVQAIGIDEIAWARGHTYLTVIYEIGSAGRRLLAVVEDRKESSLKAGLESLGEPVLKQIRFVCSDMWRPYLSVIATSLNQAVHVLDRFHVMKLFGKALDEIRADEVKRLKRDGHEPVLTRSRWCILKRPENLTPKQDIRLKDLLTYNLRTVKGYLIREDFQQFWDYRSGTWAGKFLDRWIATVMRTDLEPLKKVADSLRNHRPLLLNWFAAKGAISAGAVEGMNNKLKLVTRKSYGFRTSRVAKLALLHKLGNLPEPDHLHKFC